MNLKDANRCLALALLVGAATALSLRADELDEAPAAPAVETPGGANAATPEADLAVLQSKIATRYKQVEDLLLKLREYESLNNNTRRVDLLTRAYEMSKTERRTFSLLESVRDQLGKGDLKNAMKGQELAIQDLRDMLELLKLEDRGERIKSERQKIKEYIKEVERLIRLQRSLRGANEGGADADQVAKTQGQVADRTGDLSKQIKQDEGSAEGEGGTDGEEKSNGDPEGDSKGDSEGDSKGDSEGDSKGDSEGDSKGDSEGDSKSDSEGDSKGDSEGDSKGDSEGDSKGDSEGDSKGDSEGSSKGDSEGNSKGDSEGDSKGDSEGDSKGDSEGDSKGDSQGGGSGKPSDQADENPVRKRIQAAEEKMRDAQRKLEEAKRKESIEDQRKAEEELQLAKQELEEILRQLREEEIERVLAMLEGRFRQMLEREIKVYEATRLMGNIAESDRGSEFDINAGKLSFEQRGIAEDADRAFNMLVEEGSSIAFPETVKEMSEDMKQVAARLARAQVSRITQGLEEDIIDSLNAMIDALVKAQEDNEQKQEEGDPPPPGEPQDQPLVDLIAEMKMIRGLQERVNKRHRRYAQLLEDPDDPIGFSDDPDIRDSLERLAERQEKIQQITRDIVLGKNQ